MQLTNKINGLALATIFAGALVSCTNDLNEPVVNKPDALPALKLVKAPDVTAWSGEQILGNTFAVKATRAAGAEVTYETCETTLIDRAHEAEIIDEYLPEKNGNLRDELDTDFLFYADKDLSLEFYPVFSQTTTPNDLGVFYYDPEGGYHEVIVWENMNPWGLTKSEWKWTDEKGSYEVVTSKGIKINVPAGCAFGFYWKGHDNTGETVYYSNSEMNEEVYYTDGGGNRLEPEQTSKIHAVTFQLEGKTYLGLEDWTDFDFQDWVFTCDKELETVDASTFEPGGTPEIDDDNNNDNGDDNGDDDGDDNNGDDNGDEEENDVPDVETPVTNPTHKNEVEINLSIEDLHYGYDVADLVSKLSIHVRYPGDVEVFIPVPKGKYIDADDMAIVMKHEENHMGYNEAMPVENNTHTFTYTLKDSDLQVTLTVQYEEDGIRITTDGITQEVIDWCYEKCKDGINFEIWNYYDIKTSDGEKTSSLEELKEYLDQATVKFLDDEPDYYINAFTEEGNDCTVSIVDEQSDLFNEAVEGEHLNGSSKNQIYENKNPKSQEE